MIFILQFLFFIFIAFLVVGIIISASIYMKIRRAAGKFRDFAGKGFSSNAFNSSDNTNPGGGNYKKKGVTIIDNRNNFEKTRKIFPESVGEYVKYKEVKH